MKKLEKLTEKELFAMNGGSRFWGPFWVGYLVSEVINGIQDGLSRDCADVPCANEC